MQGCKSVTRGDSSGERASAEESRKEWARRKCRWKMSGSSMGKVGKKWGTTE